MTSNILKGIRVLDLSRMLSGPYCTMMLADHGAEVIKIEAESGDTSRSNGPFRSDDSSQEWAGYFVSLNRGKKSVQLDLKTDAGKAGFRALAATADVVVENFRPGVMDQLGLSYESLARINPKLVYGAIRGFGDPRTGTSPYADWPSYDVVAQAMGGVMAITGPEAGMPTKVGPGIGDLFTGLMMSFGIMAALRQAEATGRGEFVDVAMYDAMISLCERSAYLHDITGTVPGPEGNGHPLLAPFGLFPATDGQVAIGVGDDSFWQSLTEAMAQPALGRDPRYATRAARIQNRAEVDALVATWTAAHSKAALAELLGGKVPFGPLNTIKDIFADPHVSARKMLTQIEAPDGQPWTVAANPLRFAGQDTGDYAAPPRLGQHNDVYLSAARTPPMPHSEKLALRDAFGTFATGVTIVTTREADGMPRGFTANSFSSVSLDPPLLLICIAKTAHSRDAFVAAQDFAVNVLAEDQKAVSGLFASRAADKFAQTEWSEGPNGVPILDGVLASFVCTRHKLVDAGDHLVLIGRVTSFEATQKQPLGYFRGGYFSLGLEDSLVKAAAEAGKSIVGVVLTQNGKVLLQQGANGALGIPKSPSADSSLSGLIKELTATGLTPEIGQLYAVFHDKESGLHMLYYHGSAAGTAPANMRFYPLDAIPWEAIASKAERNMLSHYSKEFGHGDFGIYHGDHIDGTVHRISSSR